MARLRLSEGKRFETKELASLLELYQEIAWGSPRYARDRVNYYYLFFNNARMFKQNGASMYYAEKIAEEYEKIGEGRPLIAQLQQCRIYQTLRSFDKIIGIYDEERSFLESLPNLLQKDDVDHSVGLNAMYILSPVLSSFIETNDTAAVQRVAQLGRRIGKSLRDKSPVSRPQMLYNDLLMIDIEHSHANFAQRYSDARALLDSMEALKAIYKDQATNFIDINLVRMRLENYLKTGNVDSARVYLARYETSPNFGDGQRAKLAEYQSKLQALEGNYRAAHASLTDALKYERDVQSALIAESSDLLYAFTAAEHSQIALQRAERIKEERTLWLVVISTVALSSILAIYLAMVYKARKSKAQIASLNNSANLQIVAMEEAKYQAVREEQQRLGQDLHDGLSSSIAGIRHQIEVLGMETDDASLKRRLVALQAEVDRIYDTARRKSHEWFSASDGQEEQTFEHRVRSLIDGALPDSSYQKDILIDEGSLRRIHLDSRIALLRIIQEGITNIIKHARAKKIGILIYEETDCLQLIIHDDGIGMDEWKHDRKRNGLGLQSIQRRVQYLDGVMAIHSDANGTEITISVPFGMQ